ncbi:MAG: hypothetical protein ACTHXA_02050 [Gulosibacter sp.]|uniref:hypothetical protein n=1 Tax=Gulosibacter sp. TaxID=2817531 RepID=UPI003F92D124
MTANQIIKAPQASFSARLRAALRVDILPSLLGGAIGLTCLLVAPALAAWITSRLGGMAEINLGSPAGFIAGLCVALAIIMTSEASTGRRESTIGGWTRQERLQLTTIIAVGMAIVTALLLLLASAITPALENVLQSIAANSQVTYTVTGPSTSIVAAIVVALAAFAGAFVPAFLMRLSGIHWIAVVGGSILLLAILQILFVAYYLHAEPNGELFTAFAHTPELWFVLSIIVTAGFVLLTIAMTRKAPIRRYRA